VLPMAERKKSIFWALENIEEEEKEEVSTLSE
jgi:hypothetical protein